MSEMVERVARAMYDFAEGAGQWESASASDVAMATDLARAAIAAMREPTKGMYLAGLNSSGTIHAVWEALIDEALK